MLLGSNVRVGNVMNKMLPVVDSVSYLLDTYPAFAAYSTRQLSSTATNCMDVREDGTGTTATIGFSAGWVDEAAIASHCGANNGFVSKWYDQSGNAYDAAQATTTEQGKIYNGSAVIKQNGKPTISCTALSNVNYTFSPTSVSQPYTIYTVANNNASATFQYLYSGNAGNPICRWTASETLDIYADTLLSGPTVSTGQALIGALYNSTSSKSRLNGNEEASGDAGAGASDTSIVILNDTGGGNAVEDAQEFIFWDSDQTANFSAIESDINTAFSIY